MTDEWFERTSMVHLDRVWEKYGWDYLQRLPLEDGSGNTLPSSEVLVALPTTAQTMHVPKVTVLTKRVLDDAPYSISARKYPALEALGYTTRVVPQCNTGFWSPFWTIMPYSKALLAGAAITPRGPIACVDCRPALYRVVEPIEVQQSLPTN